MSVIDCMSGENRSVGVLDHVAVSNGAGVYRLGGAPTGEAVKTASFRSSSRCPAASALPSKAAIRRLVDVTLAGLRPPR